MMKIFNMNRKGHFLFALVIAAITVVACGNKTANAASTADSLSADDATAQSEDYTPKRSDYTFRSEVRTINDDGEVRWDTIVVYLTDAKGHTQQLYSQAQPLDTATWSKGSIGKISEDDWNFDGIPDLQVCMGPMNSSMYGFGTIRLIISTMWKPKMPSSIPKSMPTRRLLSASGASTMRWKSSVTSGKMANWWKQNVNSCRARNWLTTKM